MVELARQVEGEGYSHLYLPEAGQVDLEGRLSGRDPFVTFGAVFEATSTLIGGVGVAPTIFHRMPQLALRAASLAEQSGGRFHLGIGVSHREAAARMDVPFPASPLGHVRSSLAELRQWQQRLRFGQEFPIVIGALGPKMVNLGATEGDGVVLNWLTPALARTTVTAAQEAAGGKRPLTLLYIRIGDLATMRNDAVNYDRMINYHQHFLAQGLDSPESIVAGTCLDMADLGAVRAAIDTYAETGLDVLCLYPHGIAAPERLKLLQQLAAR